MRRFSVALAAAAALLVVGVVSSATDTTAIAQDAKPKAAKAAAASKVGAGMKMCTYKFPNGEKRNWTCEKAQPCCAWDEIQYTKCGSTITGCL